MIIDIIDFIPLTATQGSGPVPLASAYRLPSDDLFGSVALYIDQLLSDQAPAASVPLTDGCRFAFTLENGFALSAQLDAIRPSHLQCLLSFLHDEAPISDRAPLEGHILDAGAGLTLWTPGTSEAVARMAKAWAEIMVAGSVDRLTAMTTPSLYGNKLRLTRFIAPVAYTALPIGAPVLDLMSGTGVLGRALADRHPIFPNDPNPYAALLSGAQRLAGQEFSAAELVSTLRPAFLANHASLAAEVQSLLDEESGFLHGETDDVAITSYAGFINQKVLQQTDGKNSSFARLITERYANVYFGLAQSIEIDSLRFAIESKFPDGTVEKEFCLAALLIACMTCASGPHFAQPVRPRSERAMRTIIERRARSVSWEFDLALGRLLGRPAPKFEMAQATSLDWRVALAQFAERWHGSGAGVYVDPPYSKLQYSRYYHVLNVLLAYDYPDVHGSGLYPPRTSRFSSKFEYQPGVARREFAELLSACANYGMTTLISYGDTGFVDTDTLLELMRARFQRVDAFSEKLRHHSQGRVLTAGKGSVREHVFVGYP